MPGRQTREVKTALWVKVKGSPTDARTVRRLSEPTGVLAREQQIREAWTLVNAIFHYRPFDVLERSSPPVDKLVK